MRAAALALLWLVTSVAIAVPADAHDRGTSYSSWTIRGRDANVVVRIAELELTRFPWGSEPENTLDPQLRRYFSDHLQLWAGDRRCAELESPHPITSAPGYRAYEWKLRCPSEGALAIRSTLMMEVSPQHLHFARLNRDGTTSVERLLSERDQVWRLEERQPDAEHGASVADYVLLGIEHILSGYDHLAFVLALLLLATSLGEVARVVTGFTLAHTITLCLMALGYLRPDRDPIEALIGLSIALVAVENSWRLADGTRRLPFFVTVALVAMSLGAAAGFGKVSALTLAGLALFVACYFQLLLRLSSAASLRWGIAFIFGLIHGFGFAGVLTEAGLPSDRTIPALLGFNVGVEIGQLAVVAMLWPLLRLLERRRAGAHRLLLEAGSAAVFALGLYWFVVRSYG